MQVILKTEKQAGVRVEEYQVTWQNAAEQQLAGPPRDPFWRARDFVISCHHQCHVVAHWVTVKTPPVDDDLCVETVFFCCDECQRDSGYHAGLNLAHLLQSRYYGHYQEGAICWYQRVVRLLMPDRYGSRSVAVAGRPGTYFAVVRWSEHAPSDVKPNIGSNKRSRTLEQRRPKWLCAGGMPPPNPQ